MWRSQNSGGFPFLLLVRMMFAMNVCLATLMPFSGLDTLSAAFDRYARTFYTGEAEHDFHLDLKAEHSRNVYAHARAIAGNERVFAEDAGCCRALLLAALYHDVGRFRQYHEYRTFSDAQSINHAVLSAREVRRQGFLAGEDLRVRRLTLAAIALHNRFALSSGLAGDLVAVAKAVRDADKLDIMRIMAGHLAGEGEPDPVVALHTKISPEFSPAILDAVMNRRLGSYKEIVTTTDFKLLVCGWLYDLNFAVSRETAARSGYLGKLLDSLPPSDALQAFSLRYKKELALYAGA